MKNDARSCSSTNPSPPPGAAASAERSGVAIACNLDVFTTAERAREAELLAKHRARSVRRRDEPGFVYDYGSDPEAFVEIAELVALEHRCCPFLDFVLTWRGPSEGPALLIEGPAEGAELIAAAFG